MAGQRLQCQTFAAAGVKNTHFAAADVQAVGNAGQRGFVSREVAVFDVIAGHTVKHQMVLLGLGLGKHIGLRKKKRPPRRDKPLLGWKEKVKRVGTTPCTHEWA